MGYHSPEALEKQRVLDKEEWLKKDAVCKDCLKNPKQNGSRRCKECSDEYKSRLSTLEK